MNDEAEYKLTDKQKIFCEEYLVDFNATRAAIAAGYSEKAAKEIGAENLTKPNIQKFIKERQNTLINKLHITQEAVLQELAKIGFSNVKDFVNGGNSILELKGIETEKTAAVSGVKTTFNENTNTTTTELKFHDKVSALEKLGKHLGIFEKDNSQSRPQMPAKLQVEIVPPIED